MQKKGEKTYPENFVPICPALSPFVHQPPILQHYKSPLLCSGVTNRRGQGCNRAGTWLGIPFHADPNPSVTDFDFRQKIARCVLYATKPFSVPENALPLAGVKITPKS